MVETTGDILNWLVAGVLFPLMILPLAVLFSTRRTNSIGLYFLLTAGAVLTGSLFVYLVPVLQQAPDVTQLAIFSAIAFLVGVGVLLTGGAHSSTHKLADFFQTVTTGAGRAVMWLLLIMALVQFAVVLLRYVFGVNSLFMQESITYMHGFVFLIAAGYALITGDHVRVDIFYRDATPKRKAIIDLLGTYIFLFPICLIILWTASPYVARSWAFFEGSADTSGIQGVFILKTLIPIFAVLLAMAGFVVAHRSVETLRGRAE